MITKIRLPEDALLDSREYCIFSDIQKGDDLTYLDKNGQKKHATITKRLFDFLDNQLVLIATKKETKTVDTNSIKKLIFSNECNGRLRNILFDYIDQYETDNIKEVTEKKFLAMRNAGKKSWLDFCQITNFNFK
ncbi:hypothetical protein [Mesoflavibacter sp. CH_XMU1404-2]|uniref:hypothetical protein n=1 Tax=Mesoflavibacter sp. CH_XMU1404-2 TaxID=3107766 RepID=UPI003009B780